MLSSSSTNWKTLLLRWKFGRACRTAWPDRSRSAERYPVPSASADGMQKFIYTKKTTIDPGERSGRPMPSPDLTFWSTRLLCSTPLSSGVLSGRQSLKITFSLNLKKKITFYKPSIIQYINSVADPHHCDAHPDQACHFHADVDPDSVCHFDADADPDPTFHFDAVLNLDPSFQIKAQNLSKSTQIDSFWHQLMRIRTRI